MAGKPVQKQTLLAKKRKQMFLAGKPVQKQTLLAKKGKQMFLAGKPVQKQTLLAKKRLTKVPGWEKASTLRMLAGENGY